MRKQASTLAIQLIERTGRFLASGSGAISAFFFAAMVSVTFLGVFFRYVIRDPLQWTEELARFLMLWAGFLAMNVAMHYRQHINIDVLLRYVPSWLSKLLRYFSDLLICYFLIILMMKGYSMSTKTMMTASSMKFSMTWVYMAVPLGALLTLVQVVLNLSGKMLHDLMPSSNNQPTPAKEEEE